MAKVHRTIRVLGAALTALVLAPGCSHAAATKYEPNIPIARLSQVPPSELGDVKAQQAQLDNARQTLAQASREAADAKSQLQLAKSSYDLAKSQVKEQKQRAKMSSRQLAPGAEQRAAQEGPGAYPPVSDLYAAELKQQAAKLRVAYLEKLKDYAEARRDVADRLVGYNQAKLDQTVYGALQRTRPEEAAALQHRGAWFANKVTERQSDLADARAHMDKKRGEATQRFDSWQAAFAKVRPADRGAAVPAPDSLPPL